MGNVSWSPTDGRNDLPETPAALREEIPALADHTYFNWGASGPSPRSVVESIQAAIQTHEYESPAEAGMYPAADAVFDAARNRIASLLGVESGQLALTQSTTEGINRVGTAIDWSPGDVVVTTDLEHAAGRLPWTRLESASDIEVRVIETNAGAIDLETVDSALTDADLFCFSAIDWIYGRSHPVPSLVSLAHENDALALVDAVQVPGQQAIDVESWNADFVAGAGHKWLLGPWGAGFLYVSDHIIDSVEPIHVGYRSVESAAGGTYELAEDARRFELGTMSPAPFAGLHTAIELHETIGAETIRQRIQELRHRLLEAIPSDQLHSPREADSGLLTIRVKDPERAVDTLESKGITVRSLPLSDSVRVSIHAMNTETEIDTLEAELRRLR